MTETPPSDDDLKLLRRHWPHSDDADRSAVWAAAKEIYGGGTDWEAEFAADLSHLRPDGKGGLESQGRIHRTMMARWRKGPDPIPPWGAEGLLRLPEMILGRQRSEVARQTEKLRKEEARLAGWVAAQVERHVPSIERDPTRRPPPPRPPTPDREWPAVSAEEVERTEDIGSLAAKVAMGVVEPEPAPRPEHPVLADAWERGWDEAYDFELGRMREAAERQAAAEAAVEAAAEAERAAKEKVKARKEARRAADLRRRLARK